MTKARRRRRGRAVVTAALLLAAAAVGGYLVVKSRQDSLGLADPATVSLPAPPLSNAATVSYFRGDGAAVLKLLHATAALPANPAPGFCTSLSQQLEPIGGPAQLGDRAVRIPDASARAAALNHVDAVVAYAKACPAGAAATSAAHRTHFTGTVLQRLLEQDGAA